MNYEYYVKHPKELIEFKLNMTIAKNPNLISSLDRIFNHSLIRKRSNIPFKKIKGRC